MSGENKTPAASSAGETTNESDDVQAFGTPITVGGDGGKAEAAAVTGTPITLGGDGSPQPQ
jgi:hypothetical protein